MKVSIATIISIALCWFRLPVAKPNFALHHVEIAVLPIGVRGFRLDGTMLLSLALGITVPIDRRLRSSPAL